MSFSITNQPHISFIPSPQTMTKPTVKSLETPSWVEQQTFNLEQQLEEICHHGSYFNFLRSLLDLIKKNFKDDQKLKHIVEHPFVIRRIYKESDPAVWDTLIEFIYDHSFLLNNHLVEKFIAQQCVKLQLYLTIAKNSHIKLDTKIQLHKILVESKLPLSIDVPFRAVASFFEEESIPSIHIQKLITSTNQQQFEIPTFYNLNASLKLLAINVADLIDGSNFRYNSIRLLIHQGDDAEKKQALYLVKKVIDEFDSGRRKFIFSNEANVPFQNYTTVMLYVIRCLKEDRKVYYDKHPLDENKYNEDVLTFDKGDFSYQSDEKQKNLFEWVARRLILLEKRIEESKLDSEIKACLDDFHKFYKLLPNLNLELTICSCIDPSVFVWYTAPNKPIVYCGIPDNLTKLAKDMGIQGNFSTEVILGSILEAANLEHHPENIPKKIDNLKTIYDQSVKEPENKELAKKFILAWNQIPQNKTLLTDGKHVEPLKQLIASMQSQIGVSPERLKELIKKYEKRLKPSRILIVTFDGSERKDSLFQSKIKGLYGKYPSVFNSSDFDSESSYAALLKLKEEIDDIKKDHAEDLKNHWIISFSEELDALFKEKAFENYQKPFVNFDIIKDAAANRIFVQVPHLDEKIFSFKRALNETHGTNLLHLNFLFEKLLDLKNSLKNAEKLSLSAESKEILFHAYNFIKRLEIGIAEQLSHEKDLQSPEVFKLFSDISLCSGITQDVVQNSEQFIQALKKVKSQIYLGYENLRQFIINDPNLLNELKNRATTLESAVQMIQGCLNTGMVASLDKFVMKTSSEEVLSGLTTKHCGVLGKIRIMDPQDPSPAKKDEICVVPYISPEIHQYLEASAIISGQGGLFSHAAITLGELGIPALLGCQLKTLADYRGKWVHLHLGKEPTITTLPLEAQPIVENLSTFDANMAEKLEKLPEEIGKLIADRYYHTVFNTLSTQEIAPFLKYPLAKYYLSEERKKISLFEKRLLSSENTIEKIHLFEKIIKALRKLPISTEETFIELKRIQSAHSNIMLQKVPFGKSGKKENLDRLQNMLSDIKLTHLQLSIPNYKAFSVDKLIWFRFPEIKKEIQVLLQTENLTPKEKSEKILYQLSQLEIDAFLLDDLQINGDIIVRSSAALEDQANSAAAGIFSSEVVQDRKNLPKALKNVLASSFSEKALTFYSCLETKKSEAIFDMTWVVQKYISQGQYSGVAFSVAKEEQWHISGMQLVKGLGGGVDGLNVPVQAFVDTKKNILHDLQLNDAELPCSIEIIHEIAELTKRLENICGFAVEIEFVVHEKTLHIVQLRPIIL